jgi:predicted permease
MADGVHPNGEGTEHANWEETMFQDIRYAIRILMKSKGWTLMVVLSLALGIGANAALFSGINGLLLRKLPVANPDALVRLKWFGDNDAITSASDYGYNEKNNGIQMHSTFSYPMYLEFRKANQTMLDLFACAPSGAVNLAAGGRAEIAHAFMISGNYYAVLGVRQAAGRLITPSDDRPGATPVAVISYAYWTRRFGNDPGIVGNLVRVNNIPVTIIGVTDSEFIGVQTLLGEAPDISFPLAVDPFLNRRPGQPSAAAAAVPKGIQVDDPYRLTPLPGAESRLSQATSWWLQVMGRVKPGVGPQEVAGNLGGVFQSAARDGLRGYLESLTPEARARSNNRNRSKIPSLNASPGSRGIYDADSNTLRSAAILSFVVALILLIVCANVANLLLSRAAARQKEISVRLSLGAGRLRVIRQLLTESVLLSLLGATCGAVVASWARQLLPGPSARSPLDWHFFLFLLGLALVTGLIFGIAPALRATNVSAALKETSRTLSGSPSVLSKVLLVAQIAISIVLLTGAGLFLRTLRNLERADVGFDPLNLVLFQINPSLNRYDQERIASVYRQAGDRLKAIPGVRDVAISDVALLSGSVLIDEVVPQGKPYSPGGETSNSANLLKVSPNFFEVMKMPLAAGRSITSGDTLDSPKVAVVNEAAARKFFPGENPIGRRFGSSPEDSGKIEIVGIVSDAKYDSVRDAAPPTVYVPFFQYRLFSANFAVRTAIDPAGLMGSIREAVRQTDPDLPSPDFTTQIEQIGRRFDQERLFAQAYTLFGSLALLVASIGLFGLMSYNVTRRTNEFGIRMALGAQRNDVVALVMRESLVLVFVGLAVGLAAALAVGRFITTLLYGLGAGDPLTILLASLVMTTVAIFAGYLPARRASRVEPTEALRYE